MRAYAPIAKRQQGADRLAYNEDDLRRILWQAVDPNFTETRPATIRLGADIVLTRPIKLYPGQYNITIDGGRQFGIIQSPKFERQVAVISTLNCVFYVPDGVISDISLENLYIRFDVDFYNATVIPAVFIVDQTTVFKDLVVNNCSITNGLFTCSLFKSSSGTGGTFESASVYIDDENQLFVPAGTGGALFTGKLSVRPEIESTYKNSTLITHRNDIGFGVRAIPQLSLETNGAFRMHPASITLAGTDPVLTVGDRSVFEITIDNATATGDMDMTAGKDGQIVVLYFTNTATTLKLGDYGNIDVNKNYTSKKPLQDETVTFIWLASKWREIARSENN
jgi:hypothetical protein